MLSITPTASRMHNVRSRVALEPGIATHMQYRYLVAGHETTAITLSYFMYNVARHPHVQERLRTELHSIGTDAPTIEQISSLRYLENVLREVLRLYPAIPSSLRMSMDDDTLPLSEPINIDGVMQDRIW